MRGLIHGEKDVLRLEVPVYDPFSMKILDPTSDTRSWRSTASRVERNTHDESIAHLIDDPLGFGFTCMKTKSQYWKELGHGTQRTQDTTRLCAQIPIEITASYEFHDNTCKEGVPNKR